MNDKIEKNYSDYKKFVKAYIERDGVEVFLDWLDKTDAKIAPASTKYNNSYEGGLMQYVLNVFYRLIDILRVEYPNRAVLDAEGNPTGETVNDNPYSKETVAIVSLMHCVNKINYYKTDYRNVKDENGNWTKVPYYAVRDDIPFFGDKQDDVLGIIDYFFKLSYEEKLAIKFCMGTIGNDSKFAEANMFKAFKTVPLALYLHQAILGAICIDDNERDNKQTD